MGLKSTPIKYMKKKEKHERIIGTLFAYIMKLIYGPIIDHCGINEFIHVILYISRNRELDEVTVRDQATRHMLS